jgi:hypothetical protein
MRKPMTRMNQKVRDQVIDVNGVYNDTRSISGEKVEPNAIVVQLGERGKPDMSCNSRNLIVRKGDDIEGTGCEKKQMLRSNSRDRVNNSIRKDANFSQVLDLQ